MSSIQEIFASFTPVSVKEAESHIATDHKFVLFVGRISCPYCQRFAPKLAEVAKGLGIEVFFLNSEDANDIEAIQAFRTSYNIPTVPGFLVATNGQAKVICDSSLPEEEISAFIGK